MHETKESCEPCVEVKEPNLKSCPQDKCFPPSTLNDIWRHDDICDVVDRLSRVYDLIPCHKHDNFCQLASLFDTIFWMSNLFLVLERVHGLQLLLRSCCELLVTII